MVEITSISVALAVLILPEVGELSLIGGLHGGSAGGPAGGADFAVLVSVLEGLDKAEGLLHVTADGEVTNRDVSNDSLIIDDVGGTEGDASVAAVLNEAAVLLGNLLGHVCYHGDGHLAETASLAVLLGVLHVSEVRVDRSTDHLATDSLEVLCAVRELADLSRAHKGEVERPEE